MLLRVLTVTFLCCCSAIAAEGDLPAFEERHGGTVNEYFRDEVWAKVAHALVLGPDMEARGEEASKELQAFAEQQRSLP